MRVIDALDAAGKDLILIETVGTGQSEIDVAEVADVRVVVTAPGLGDDIQAMKAGLIEIADIMVVNKADREGADRTAAAAEGGAVAAGARPRSKVPVLKTTATTGAGVEALAGGHRRYRRARRLAEGPRARRRRRARYLIARAAAERIARRVKEGSGGDLDQLADAVLAGTLTPDEAAGRLLEG